MVSFVLKELEAKGVYQIIDIADIADIADITDIADIADISIGSLVTSALAALKIFVQGHPDQKKTHHQSDQSIDQPFHQ